MRLFGSQHGVRKQHRNGQWTDPAQSRSDPAGHFADVFVHVGEKFLALPTDSAADHNRSGLHHVFGDRAGSTDGSDNDVGFAGVLGDVGNTGVHNGGRRIGARLFRRHEQSHRPTERGPPTDDHDILALYIDLVVLQHLNDAGRRARERTRLLEHELSEILWMETVGVLGRVDECKRFGGIESVGKRQLQDVAVHRRVGVEVVQRLDERRLASFGWDRLVMRGDSDLLTRFMLLLDVRRRRSIIPDENRAEADLNTLRFERCSAGRNIGEYGFGHGATGEELSSHSANLPSKYSRAVFPLKDENPTMRLPIVTIALIVVNVLVYFLLQPVEIDAGTDFTFETAAIPDELTSGEPLSEQEYCSVLAPNSEAFTSIAGTADICTAPSADARFPDKNVYLAALSSMFLHGGLMHLGGNMLFLWVFGNNIEDHLGRLKYLVFYLFAGVVASIAHVAGDPDSLIPVIGASGAVAGVMGAYIVWFPWARVKTIAVIVLLDLRAWIVLTFWFGSQFFISPTDGIAWLAHVGGFIAGAVIALGARTNDNFRQRLWQHKYLTQHPQGQWDPRFGGREILEDSTTPSWHPGP